MSESLPWNEDKPLSLSQLLKHSMRSVDTLVSNNTLLDKMAIHLNGLLRQDEEPQVDKAVQLFDNMFLHAERAMSLDSDKQVLNVLKRQVSSFIGVTLGVKPFLEKREHEESQILEEEEEEESEDDASDEKPNKLSWNKASQGEASSYQGAAGWSEKKNYYEQNNMDIYSPERAEHERLRRELEEEQYGHGGQHGEHESGDEDEEEEEDSDEYEEIVERVEIKSREMGGAGGFTEVRRRQKKKKTKKYIETNFSYSHNSGGNPYEGGCGRPYEQRPPRHHVQVTEFHPRYLDRLPEETFCFPVFFPSEDSYRAFHSALSTAKHTLYVCVFSMTDNDTADVLSDAKRRGVDVRIITDNDQMDPAKGADVHRLNERANIPFKCDDSEQFMHNKFAVIDNKIVITGSFNWSAGARYKNRENIIITNIPSVVRRYADEFEKLWNYF